MKMQEERKTGKKIKKKKIVQDEEDPENAIEEDGQTTTFMGNASKFDEESIANCRIIAFD